MSDYDIRFSKKFKERNNIKNIGAVVGNVLSVEPLKIGILNNAVMLDSDNCHLCNSLVENFERKATMEIKAYSVNASASVSGGGNINSLSVSDKSDYDTVITFKDILKVGDLVLVIADTTDQEYFILDKVVM